MFFGKQYFKNCFELVLAKWLQKHGGKIIDCQQETNLSIYGRIPVSNANLECVNVEMALPRTIRTFRRIIK